MICDVLFVCPYDSIFCVLLNCCEEKGETISERGRRAGRTHGHCGGAGQGLAARRPGLRWDMELTGWVGSGVTACGAPLWRRPGVCWDVELLGWVGSG